MASDLKQAKLSFLVCSLFLKDVSDLNQWVWLTLVTMAALTLPVWRTCGPRQRSMSGPHLQVRKVSSTQQQYELCHMHLYTVVVGVVTRSLSIRHLNLLYCKRRCDEDYFHQLKEKLNTSNISSRSSFFISSRTNGCFSLVIDLNSMSRWG